MHLQVHEIATGLSMPNGVALLNDTLVSIFIVTSNNLTSGCG